MSKQRSEISEPNANSNEFLPEKPPTKLNGLSLILERLVKTNNEKEIITTSTSKKPNALLVSRHPLLITLTKAEAKDYIISSKYSVFIQKKKFFEQQSGQLAKILHNYGTNIDNFTEEDLLNAQNSLKNVQKLSDDQQQMYVDIKARQLLLNTPVDRDDFANKLLKLINRLQKLNFSYHQDNQSKENFEKIKKLLVSLKVQMPEILSKNNLIDISSIQEKIKGTFLAKSSSYERFLDALSSHLNASLEELTYLRMDKKDFFDTPCEEDFSLQQIKQLFCLDLLNQDSLKLNSLLAEMEAFPIGEIIAYQSERISQIKTYQQLKKAWQTSTLSLDYDGLKIWTENALTELNERFILLLSGQKTSQECQLIQDLIKQLNAFQAQIESVKPSLESINYEKLHTNVLLLKNTKLSIAGHLKELLPATSKPSEKLLFRERIKTFSLAEIEKAVIGLTEIQEKQKRLSNNLKELFQQKNQTANAVPEALTAINNLYYSGINQCTSDYKVLIDSNLSFIDTLEQFNTQNPVIVLPKTQVLLNNPLEETLDQFSQTIDLNRSTNAKGKERIEEDDDPCSYLDNIEKLKQKNNYFEDTLKEVKAAEASYQNFFELRASTSDNEEQRLEAIKPKGLCNLEISRTTFDENQNLIKSIKDQLQELLINTIEQRGNDFNSLLDSSSYHEKNPVLNALTEATDDLNQVKQRLLKTINEIIETNDLKGLLDGFNKDNCSLDKKINVQQQLIKKAQELEQRLQNPNYKNSLEIVEQLEIEYRRILNKNSKLSKHKEAKNKLLDLNSLKIIENANLLNTIDKRLCILLTIRKDLLDLNKDFINQDTRLYSQDTYNIACKDLLNNSFSEQDFAIKFSANQPMINWFRKLMAKVQHYIKPNTPQYSSKGATVCEKNMHNLLARHGFFEKQPDLPKVVYAIPTA